MIQLRALGLALLLAAAPAAASASTVPDRLVLKVLDADGLPVAGASIMTIEGATGYMRQGIVRADSNGVAVAEVGKEAYVGLRILVPGFDLWKLDLAPGAPERKARVIEVRLEKKSRKGPVVPVSY